MAAEQVPDALLHLVRRPVGEGDGEDLGRVGQTLSIRWAIRWVSTRVLPEPAPATISSGPSVCSTASRCGGFRPSSDSPADVSGGRLT